MDDKVVAAGEGVYVCGEVYVYGCASGRVVQGPAHKPTPLGSVQTRVTVVGFMLAIYAFTLGQFVQLSLRGESFATYLSSLVALLLGFVWCLSAMAAFLWSQKPGEETASLWPLALGEIFLWIGVAAIVSGTLNSVVYEITEQTMKLQLKPGMEYTANAFSIGLLWVTGAVWFLAAYVFPMRHIWSHGASAGQRTGFMAVFVAVLLATFLVQAQATHVRLARCEKVSLVRAFVRQFVQPYFWPKMTCPGMLPKETSFPV